MSEVTSARRGTPQYTAQLIWATLHVAELLQRGWIEGGFEVETDRAWASLRGLIVIDHVTEPDRELTRRTALGIMTAKPEFAPESDEDIRIAYDLLGKLDLVWPDDEALGLPPDLL